MSCYVMLCYVMSCHVMLCYVMLCYVILCYVISWYIALLWHFFHLQRIVFSFLLTTTTPSYYFLFSSSLLHTQPLHDHWVSGSKEWECCSQSRAGSLKRAESTHSCYTFWVPDRGERGKGALRASTGRSTEETSVCTVRSRASSTLKGWPDWFKKPKA